jgi:hypothetical protein
LTITERGSPNHKVCAAFVRARQWLRIGLLPNAGGWLDQSAKLVMALEIILDEESALSTQR